MQVAITSLLSSLPGGVIFAGLTDAGHKCRVRINGVAAAAVGDVYAIEGREEVFRDRWGNQHRQIEATSAERVRTSGRLILPWLESLPGVGPVRAKRLFEAFGRDGDLVERLSDPDNVEVVAKAIDPTRPRAGRLVAAVMCSAILERSQAEQGALAELGFLQRLERLGVTDRRAAARLWRLIGYPDAEARLLLRPYLTAVVLPWASADHVGQRLLAGRGDGTDPFEHPERLAGACDAVWRVLAGQGDTASTEARFASRLVHLLSTGGRRVDREAAMSAGEAARAFVRQGNLLRAPGAAWLEDDLSLRLAAIGAETRSMTLSNASEGIRAAEARTSLVLTDEQRAAVEALLDRPLGILQGGAGTGKTTVMRVVVDAWEAAGGNVTMACTSGKAADLLSRATSTCGAPRVAKTIARTLLELRQRERREAEGLPVKPEVARMDGLTLLIVDEASMVDTASFHQLVCFLPPGARLLLVGDHGQLPPIGLGRVFHDLVDDGRWSSSLTKILRQGPSSSIPRHAALVRAGRVPDIDAYSGVQDGVFHLRCRTDQMQVALARVWRELSIGAYGLDPLVCAARRDTVRVFNQARCRERKPGNETARLSALTTVAVGEPVVCTRNHYRRSLVNGQVGRVVEIDDRGVHVLWEGSTKSRVLAEEVLDDIEIAYAMTCHRAQGSAAKRVVVALEDGMLLTREWLYTAITRAQDQVVLVGPEETLTAAVDRRVERTTGFQIDRR